MDLGLYVGGGETAAGILIIPSPGATGLHRHRELIMHSPFDIEQFRFLIESSDECCIACVTAYVGENHPVPMLGHSFSHPLSSLHRGGD